jgi:hypothetical protein
MFIKNVRNVLCETYFQTLSSKNRWGNWQKKFSKKIEPGNSASTFRKLAAAFLGLVSKEPPLVPTLLHLSTPLLLQFDHHLLLFKRTATFSALSRKHIKKKKLLYLKSSSQSLLSGSQLDLLTSRVCRCIHVLPLMPQSDWHQTCLHLVRITLTLVPTVPYQLPPGFPIATTQSLQRVYRCQAIAYVVALRNHLAEATLLVLLMSQQVLDFPPLVSSFAHRIVSPVHNGIFQTSAPFSFRPGEKITFSGAHLPPQIVLGHVYTVSSTSSLSFKLANFRCNGCHVGIFQARVWDLDTQIQAIHPFNPPVCTILGAPVKDIDNTHSFAACAISQTVSGDSSAPAGTSSAHKLKNERKKSTSRCSSARRLASSFVNNINPLKISNLHDSLRCPALFPAEPPSRLHDPQNLELFFSCLKKTKNLIS